MHFNIIKYANRPFELSESGVTDCINTIVNNCNEIVSDDDVVIHIGDLSHGRKQSEDILRYIFNHLKGRKILVKGNHDTFSDEFYQEIFEEVHQEFHQEYLKVGTNLFCNYPLYESKWSETIRKIYDDGGIDELVSTRRLCHIAQTFSIFKDRKKAVELCVNRFDEDVKESFIDLYEKVDASLSESVTTEEEVIDREQGIDDAINAAFN